MAGGTIPRWAFGGTSPTEGSSRESSLLNLIITVSLLLIVAKGTHTPGIWSPDSLTTCPLPIPLGQTSVHTFCDENEHNSFIHFKHLPPGSANLKSCIHLLPKRLAPQEITCGTVWISVAGCASPSQPLTAIMAVKRLNRKTSSILMLLIDTCASCAFYISFYYNII